MNQTAEVLPRVLLAHHAAHAQGRGAGAQVVRDVARADRHRQAGSDAGQRTHQIQPRAAGHVEVGDHEVDGFRIAGDDGNGFVRVQRVAGAIAQALQQAVHHQGHHLVVVDIEHMLAVAAQRRRIDRLEPHRQALVVDQRQVDIERAAATDRAVDGDRAAVRLDDAVHDSQPETRAPADRLGREEGLEDALARVVVHATAVVAHPQVDVRPLRQPRGGQR